MRKFVVALAAVFALAAGAEAQAPPVLSGNIIFSTKSIGFILGVEWGSGSATLRGGQVVQFRVRTLKAGMIGIEQVQAAGRIYNLPPGRAGDIAGTYTSIGGGITVGGGIGAQRMQNEKGVIIEIDETAQGLAAKIAAAGVSIELQ